MNKYRKVRRGRLNNWLSGLLAVSTAVIMLSGQIVSFYGDEPDGEYALAGARSGEDITIYFGEDENKSINVHVNPESDTGLEALGDEAESKTEAKNTGLEKVEAGGFVTISPADESLLPEEAEASAEILAGKAENTAVEKVEEAVSTETTSETGAPVGNSAQDGEKEAPAGVKSAPEEDATLEADGKTEYRVFEISLDNVDEEQYQEGFKVEVSLPEDVRGRNFRLFHIHEGQEPVEIPIETVGTVDHKTGLEVVSGFEFQTDGFSEFVLQYTVDFEYEVNGEIYQYSLAGEGSITLSELIESLHMRESSLTTAEFVARIADVSFTNPSLLQVEKVENDWILTSLQSFDSEEELAITMEDGQVFSIRVTDPAVLTNLADYLSSVTINAPTNSDGVYQINAGDSYAITLSFKESGSLQFPNSGSLTYDMPEGLDAIDDFGSLSVRFKDRYGRTTTIPENNYTIQNGVLTFTWTTDPEYRALLASANNTAFTLTFEGAFSENATHIKFSDGIERDFTVSNESSVSATKVSKVDTANKKITYTVAIQSTGKSENVVVSDTVTGTGLSLNRSSISARSGTGKAVTLTPNSSGNTGNSFSYTIPSMASGEIVTFTYDVNIDPSMLTMVNGKVETTANNGVRVTSEGDPDGDTANVTNTISYTPNLQKSNGSVTNQTDTTTTLQWTITANSNPVVSMAGGTISDLIDSSSQSIMKYSGSGISIVVKDASGNEISGTPRNVSWSDLGVDIASATSWTYTVPDSDAGHAYQYEISYTTDVDTSSLTSLTTVKNKSTTDGGKESWGEGKVGAGGDETAKPDLEKTVSKIDLENKEITWNVVFTVPTEGLNKAVVTDTYPNIDKWNSGKDYAFIEKIKGALTRNNISGLLDSETFTVDYYEKNFVITFFKDGNNTPGLNGGNGVRTISITIKTEINDEWVEHAKTVLWQNEHKNKVELDYGSTIEKEAMAIVQPRNLKKTVKAAGTRTVDGVELPIYQYIITFDSVTDTTNTIDDFFNTDILQPYTPPCTTYGNEAFYIWGGDLYTWNRKLATEPVSYLLTDSGITFVTSQDSLPVSDTGFYSSYRLTYYLTVKDQTALNKLMALAAASEDGNYSITNTAVWETESGQGNIDYTYKALDKELLTSDEDLKKTDEDIYADFRITLNPGAQVLNHMEELTLTDSFEGMSILYDSIVATPSAGVSWDFSGNTATFTVPDATKIVITYKAKILFTTIGANGETIQVKFSNTATMKGHSDEAGGTAYRKNHGEGTASQYSINLLKYVAGDMTRTLNGAEFALYHSKQTGTDENGNPTYAADLTSPVTDKSGKPVKFISGTAKDVDGNILPGRIMVYGDETEDGWSIHAGTVYFLVETKAPEGYMLSGFDYQFMVSADGTTDYNRYIYSSGDIMSAKNYPGTDVMVEKQWSNGNEKHGNDTVTVKLQQRRAVGTDEAGETIWSNWSDTIREEVKNSDGDYVWQDTGEKTLTLSSGCDWRGTFAGLPLLVPSEIGSDGKALGEDVNVEYNVVETKVNGEAVDSSFVKITKTTSGGAYVFTVVNKVPYEAKGSLAFSARKVFTNGTMGTPAFTFKLTQVTGENSTTQATSSNVSVPVKLESPEFQTTDATGGNTDTVDFNQILFVKNGNVDETGEYWFLIEEDIPANAKNADDIEYRNATDEQKAAGGFILNGVKYDSTRKWIKVTVADNNDGTMSITKDPGTASDSSDGTWTNEQLGDLKITKTIQKNSQLDEDAKGTFFYAVYTEAYDNTADPEPLRTGHITIGDTNNGTNTVIEQNLPFGTYYVYELTGDPAQGGTPIMSGNGGANRLFDTAIYHVTGSGTTAMVGSTPGEAFLYNNAERVDAQTSKIWVNGNVQAWDPNVVSITLNLFRYKGDAVDRVFGTDGKVQIVVTHSENTFSAALATGYTLPGDAVLNSVTVLDSPTRYLVKVSGLDKYYNDATGGIHEYAYQFTEEPVSGYQSTGYGTVSEERYNTDGGYQYADGLSGKSAIINTPNDAVELPSTGGPGTDLIYLLGSMLVMLAGAGFILLGRRKRVE